MNFKQIPAFIFLAIGGLMSAVTVIPVVCDFLPILTFKYGELSGQMTFLGTRLPNAVTITQINGWTLIGFAGYELVGAFVAFGVVSLFLALNTWYDIIPFETVKGISINGIAGLVMGLADVFLTLLIYIGSASNVNHFGFTPLNDFLLTGYYFNNVAVTSVSLGPGFILLMLSGPVIIIGGLLSFIAKRSPSRPSQSSPVLG